VDREATRQNGAERLMAHLRPGLNVHTIQAEIEGGKMAYCFEEFIKRLQGTGTRFVTLGEAAEEARQKEIPSCVVTMAEIPGRPGKVAVQGEAVSERSTGDMGR
jgi:hypothetical protein